MSIFLELSNDLPLLLKRSNVFILTYKTQHYPDAGSIFKLSV